MLTETSLALIINK